MLDLVFEYIFASLSLIWMGKLDMYFYERFLGTCNASGCLCTVEFGMSNVRAQACFPYKLHCRASKQLSKHIVCVVFAIGRASIRFFPVSCADFLGMKGCNFRFSFDTLHNNSLTFLFDSAVKVL